METINLPLFRTRVLEVVAWCNFQLQPLEASNVPANLLRSAKTAPDKELFAFTPQERYEFINDVFSSRTQNLKNFRSEEMATAQSLLVDYRQGHLLAFFPSLNMNDGVVNSVSNGYFDFGGYPPWDTWLYYVVDETTTHSNHSHLITWVPPQYIDIAKSSVDFSPDDSLVWLSNPIFPFASIASLSEAGLLV